MKFRSYAASLLTSALAVFASHAGAADYGPPDKLTFGFDDLTEWQGLESTLDLAREGVQGGLWVDPQTNTRVKTRKARLDLAAYDSISMLVHSAKADGGTFAVVVKSDSNDTAEGDYYVDYITVNWEGWSEVTLPFNEFESHGKPRGWHRVDEIGFASSGFGMAAESIKADLALDAMSFGGGPEMTAGKDGTAEAMVPEEYADAFGFEDFNVWQGLVPDSEEPREGSYSGRWQDMETNNRIQCRSFPRDLSGYEALQLDIHSLKAGDGEFAVILLSNNETTDGIDYYLMNLPINWAGWKVLTIPLEEMDRIRQPSGFAAIDSLRMASTGYRIKTTDPTAILKFDNLRLIPETE